MKDYKIGVIGKGIIGSELIKRLIEKGYEIPFIVRNSGIFDLSGKKLDERDNYQNYLEKTNAVCLAIDTKDNGEIARNYILNCIKLSKSIVTSEKGALSNFFVDLKPYLNKIGCSATVGGGTGLLRYGKDNMTRDVMEIHGVWNGTLNYIFSEISEGRTLGEVTKETQILGYAEPGSCSALEIINKEATRDIPMKTSIVINFLGIGEIRARDIDASSITEQTLKRLIKEHKKRRYIVSITREKQEEDVIGGFNFSCNDWFVSAGFKNRDENPLFSNLNLSGVDNAILMYAGKDGIDGTYVLMGQGAGAGPTTSAMIKDLEELL